jgi:hypothetical protein
MGIAFSWFLLFLANIIPGPPFPENFGMNERWVWLKTAYLLSGISKTLRLTAKPAG